jgi:hypothetical protein
MSDYTNLLNQLPTPDQLLAEDLDREESEVVDLRRHRTRRWLVTAAATAAGILAVIFGLNALDEDSGPLETVDTATTRAPTTTAATTITGTTIAPDETGPPDGAEEPDPPAVGFIVRRHITTEVATFDCAVPTDGRVCALAAAETVDLSRFGLLEVTFDPASAGESIPVIRVSKTEGLDHDELVTVEGSDFVPGEVVRLSSCPPGVDGFDSCIEQRGAYKVPAESEGTFATEIRVQQFFESILCGNEFFGCYGAAVATRPPSPVAIEFAGDPSGSTPSVSTIGPFEHLLRVRFDVSLMGATPGEEFAAQLCRLDTATLLDGGVCVEQVMGVMGNTGAAFELEMAADFDGELLTDGRVTIDCFLTDGREDIYGNVETIPTCAIRVETPTYLFPSDGITLDPSVVDALRD